MKLSKILAAALLGHIAYAQIDDPADDTDLDTVDGSDDSILEKRAFSAVTGAPGPAAPRLEIRQLAKNKDQWNLYLLALQRFKAMPQTDKMSFYQIAGIHGRPFTTWNDVPGVRSNGGYCPHVSNMFLPWHKPYLALFEQQLLVNAQQVVNSFPADQRQRWQNAYNGLRIPYWDAAIAPPNGECTVPTLIRDQQVTVTTPSGQQTIANPLYSYNFHPAGNELGGQPFNYWQYTWRRPVLPAQTARSNNNEFCSIMNNNRVSIRDRVYNLFTKTTLYRLFSTEATGGASGNPESHDSVESVHDTVHIISGGETGGHMYYLDYSAFDPVFWLWHTNIDRWGAMFQAINPDTFVEPGAQTQDNYQWNRGDIKNWYTPLKPFTSDTAGNFWYPQTTRSLTFFNYYYPETAPGYTAQSVRNAVSRLYGPNAVASSKKRDMRLATRAIDYEGHPLKAGDHDYNCHIKCDKFAVGGSYTIEFYLGGAGNGTTNGTITGGSNSTAGYNSTVGYNSSSPYYVGMSGVLAPVNKIDMQTVVSGIVPLTTALQAKQLSGELSSLEPDVVTKYLAENLHWKVIKEGGVTIPADSVNQMSVSVASQKVLAAATEDSFPTYDAQTFHPEVTSGKPGGYTGSSDYDVCEPLTEYQYVDESGQFLYAQMGTN